MQVRQNESGEYVVSGAGELHVEVCINRLREKFAKMGSTVEILVAEPVVPHCESVSAESDAW